MIPIKNKLRNIIYQDAYKSYASLFLFPSPLRAASSCGKAIQKFFTFAFVFYFMASTVFAAANISPQERKDLEVMKSSVVRVIRVTSTNIGSGTGFIVGNGKYLVTSKHVVEGENNRPAGKIVVVGKDKNHSEAFLEGYSPGGHDLALLRLSKEIGSTPVVFSPENEISHIRETQEVTVMGYPWISEIFDNDPALGMEGITITKGRITRMVENADTRLIQVDAGMEKGNSGGPLFDEWGRVIGVNTLSAPGTSAKWAINVIELFPLLRAHGISPAFSSLEEVNSINFVNEFNNIILIGVAGGLLIAVFFWFIWTRTTSKKDHRNILAVPSIKLIGLTGVHSEKQFPVDSFPFWIGRDVNCNVLFPPTLNNVSRRHCCIDKDRAGQGFTIYDNSTNGTIINGQLLTKGVPEKLTSGATIKLKSSRESFLFEAKK